MDRDRLRRALQSDGFCVVPEILSGSDLARVRDALDRAIDVSQRLGLARAARIDPNDANIRVYNLPAFDPVFVGLLRWPVARELVTDVLGPNVLVSNFTANVALPGSLSMRIHADQALVIPEPWDQPWTINIIWCLDDIYDANGATRYLPGSHRYRTFADVPPEPASQTVAFEAPAGSIIAMEGRLWHTSGANRTVDRRRRMLFAYYSMDFIRPQVNWEASLPAPVKETLDGDARKLLGLGPAGNTRIGAGLVTLAADEM